MAGHAAHAQCLGMFGYATVGPSTPQRHLHSGRVHTLFNRSDPARKTPRIPSPIPCFGKPHGIGHERFESQIAARFDAPHDVAFGGAISPDVQIQVVGQDRVGTVSRNRGTQFLDHKSVQAVTSFVQIARVTPDKRGRDQERLARFDVGLEVRLIADSQIQVPQHRSTSAPPRVPIQRTPNPRTVHVPFQLVRPARERDSHPLRSCSPAPGSHLDATG